MNPISIILLTVLGMIVVELGRVAWYAFVKVESKKG